MNEKTMAGTSNAKPEETPLLISLIFVLTTENTHPFILNKYIGDAARMIGWEHVAAARAAANLSIAIPHGWELCLGKRETSIKKRNFLQRVEKFIRLTQTLASYLNRQAYTNTRPLILFIEWFDKVHLIALILALVQVEKRRSYRLWMMYHLGFKESSKAGWYAWFHSVIENLTGSKITLLSDSDLVARSIGHVFSRQVYVMPIPHTPQLGQEDIALISIPNWASSTERLGFVVCVCGGKPIEEKGLSVIRRIVSSDEIDARQICIVIGESSRLQGHECGCKVILVPDMLSRSEYIGWLAAADIALFPYDPLIYNQRTSGVFTEAISLGRIPVVSAGTWMANELDKYDLAELIFDWTRSNVTHDLVALTKNQSVKVKLKIMQNQYNEFHSREGFAKELVSIYTAPKE